MKKKKFPLVFVLFYFFTLLMASAQTSREARIDSLNQKALGLMAQPDSLAMVAVQVYNLASQTDYIPGRAMASKLMGISHFFKGEMDKALTYYKNALELYTQLGDSLEIAKAHYNVANAYNAKHDYSETTANAVEALKWFEALEDWNGVGRIYNLLGIAAHNHDDMEKAVDYFKSYLTLVKKTGDQLEISTAYNNLGGTYSEMDKPDSAIHYLTLAEEAYRQLGGHRNLAGTYQNLGIQYEYQGDLDKALHYLNLGLERSIEDKNAYREAGIRYNLGLSLKRMGRTGEALHHLDSALRLSKSLGDKNITFHALEQLALIRAGNKQYEQAYQHLAESLVYKDSIFALEKTQIAEELLVKYESEKKEEEIQLLNQKNRIQMLQLERQKTWLAIAIALIGILALGAHLLIRQRRLKTEVRLQQTLKAQQEEATRSVLDAEEAERRRIAADLHDGVGQILSIALLNLKQFQERIRFSRGEDYAMELIVNAEELVRNSYDEMRDISHQMMPNVLIKSGLAQSVREFLHKLESENIRINLDIVGLQERLDNQTETLLYRCIQESVNNVVKHAQANHLSIQIVKDEDGISVTIEDNGIGFDPQNQNFTSGIGLKNIESRVSLLKGTLELDSVPGKGTLLAIYIPNQDKIRP